MRVVGKHLNVKSGYRGKRDPLALLLIAWDGFWRKLNTVILKVVGKLK